VVISAYNEEKNIESRLKNLKNCNYPDMEVIFVDDKSSDKTAETAQYWLDTLRFSYHLLLNETRMGTSKSYNTAIKRASRDIVVVTDADVSFKQNALFKIITRLMSDDKIGAVTGDLQPEKNNQITTGMETEYRNVYGRMCDWESAIDSTFNFNGCLMAFKKNAVDWIDQQQGADDANIAFAAIHNGYRAVYELDAVVYETIPKSFKIQYHQKIRRAKGLIEAILANRQFIDKRRPFSNFFYLRAWMLVISPSLLAASAVLFLIGSILTNYVHAIVFIAVFALGMWISPFLRAFCINQFYLIAGLFNKGKNAQVWESTSSMNKKDGTI
jgi:cellulose synthase/poly-beta-1,6-N-acetylglucosamine synthase-like glycosyltransferase